MRGGLGGAEIALRKTEQNVKEALRKLTAAERKAVGKFLAIAEKIRLSD